MSRSCDRRTVLAACALAFAGAWAAPAMSASRHFNRIVVDVDPLRAKGLSALADNVQAMLGPALAKEFAGSVDPRDRAAPTLVVRVDSVMLNGQWNGSDGANGAKLSVTDYIEGAGLVVANGKLLAEYPVLGAYDNVMGPSIMAVDSMGVRLKALTAFYAGWMRRKVGA